ncbi:macrolide family glycosyltransferase [Salininema proteolyticum]|uniref:Macrolide family glycosyltransferase n=1 Tax=Salininema proteolyticum TaxID=1607685 RepID=A0ABV8TZU6_9ACTN
MQKRRTHIAMVGIPAVSHVYPSLEVIRELVARGHRVTYANDPSVEALVTESGAEFVANTSILPTQDNDWPEDPVGAMNLFLDNAVQSLPQLHESYDGDVPDLYMYDIGGYQARAIAQRQGRPALQLSPAMVAWDTYFEEVGKHILSLPGADEYSAKFTRWLTECGVSPTDGVEFSGVPEQALALIPSAMQPHADRVDTDRVTFVGPCFDLREGGDGWARPADADNVLLVSLGSTFTRRPDFYRECLKAFGDLPGWHVVLQIGKYVDAEDLGEIPTNVEVHSWVPQRAILDEADAFVTHAGMGGSSEGLLAGVPMIAVPQAADQFMNADRLVELGVARRIDTEDATAEALRTALEELVSDGKVAERSARIQAETKAEGGTKRAADLIEALLD